MCKPDDNHTLEGLRSSGLLWGFSKIAEHNMLFMFYTDYTYLGNTGMLLNASECVSLYLLPQLCYTRLNY